MGVYSGFITLASVKDGQPVDYIVETAQEKSYKFYDTNSNIISFSPSQINFSVYKLEGGENIVIPTNEYDVVVGIVGKTGFENIFNFLNRLEGSSPDSELDLVNLYEDTVIKSINNIEFDFGKLINYTVPDTGNDAGDINLFNQLISFIEEENIYFAIKIYKRIGNGTLTPIEDNLLIVKSYPLEFGTFDDMAKFDLTAYNIQMAVNQSKLTFDATYGLTIQNGGIRILDDENKTIFGYNENNNSLFVKGNGEFTGEIHATSGSFTGDVSADTLVSNKGYIGGLILTDDGLFSKEGSVGSDESGWNTDNSILQLYGDSGRVVANSIELGLGATISQYLELGKAKLWNPKVEARGRILEAGNNGEVWLNENGVFQLGGITLDGPNSTIRGTNFTITPDVSTFNNVSVMGKISTAVFENNKVQTVGGSMFFKPSYQVKTQNGSTFTLVEKFYGSIGDYVYLIGEDGRQMSNVGQITEVRHGEEFDEIDVSIEGGINKQIFSIVDLGDNFDLIIGINSWDTNTGYLKPRGITLSELVMRGARIKTELTEDKYLTVAKAYTNLQVFSEEITYYERSGTDPDYIYTETSDVTPDPTKTYYELIYLTINDSVDEIDNPVPEVFLGDLSGLNIPNLKGYGLYSTNVYLTGSLTTEYVFGDNIVYAGINTLNSAKANVFGSEDVSRIVFWAGAKGTTNADIQASTFQVTEKGGLYASKGVFEGSLLSNAEIRGADIYTARIHGTGLENNSDIGLSFYNIANGIAFFRGNYGRSPIETFHIGPNGLAYGANENYFIDIEGSLVSFVGAKGAFTHYYSDEVDGIHIIGDQIRGYHSGVDASSLIDLGTDDEGVKVQYNSSSYMQINKAKMNLCHDEVYIDNVLSLHDSLQYQRVSDGYDLYIS